MDEMDMRKQEAPSQDTSSTPTIQDTSAVTIVTSDVATSSSSSSTELPYNKTKGHATTTGQMYEITFIALLFLRLKNSAIVTEFHLASNVDGAGALDDVVVKYKTKDSPSLWKILFVQLKHKESASFGVNSCLGSGDFSVQKYFESYLVLKKLLECKSEGFFEGCTIENCTIVLYTNAKTYDDLSRVRTDRQNVIDDLLKSNSDHEFIFSFSEDEKCDETIYDSLLKGKTQDGKEEVKNFFKNFTVFSGQPKSKQIEDIIKTELMTSTNTMKPDIDQLCKCYIIEAFDRWWHKSKTTLTQNSDILERTMMNFKLTTLSSQQVKQFTFSSLQFQKEHLFDERTLEECLLLHIRPSPLCIQVCCTKLVQSLQKIEGDYIFLGLDSLLEGTHAVMSGWNLCKRLVIVSKSTNDQQVLCNALIQYMAKYNTESCANKIIIVVSAQNDAFTLNLKTKLLQQHNNSLKQDWFFEIQDSFTVSQLSITSRERLENKDVKFQGESVKMDDLLKDGVDMASGVFNDDFIRRVFSVDPILLGPLLEETISYYVPRTLERYVTLEKEVLEQTNSDLFVAYDKERDTILDSEPDWAMYGNIDSSRDACKLLVVGSGSKEVDNISKAIAKEENAHVVRMCPDGELIRSSTKGSIENIKKFIKPENPTRYNPCTALDLEGRVILISGEAGMGKSTFVTHLASQTKTAHPSYWVVQVDLKSHLEKLDEFSDDAVQFLSSVVGVSDKENGLFRFMMENGKCVVLLDGFDEIPPGSSETGLLLLTNLLNTTASKIYITARHAVETILETHLRTLAFNLRKFDKNDQRMFFEMFWKRDKSTSNVNDQIGPLINQLLRLIVLSVNDYEGELMGTPLIAMMLAEMYEDSIELLPKKLNIITILQQVVENKFKIYLEKLFGENKNIGQVNDALWNEFLKDHMHGALIHLLDNKLDELHNGLKIREKQDDIINKIKTYAHKAGIITKVINGKPIFFHRIFAEYFTALWFSKNYNKNNGFLRTHLFSEEFNMIRRLLNLLLSSNSELLTAVINTDQKTLTSLLLTHKEDVNTRDLGGRSALHLAMGNIHMTMGTMLLLEHGAVGYGIDKLLRWNVLEYAVYSRSWEDFGELNAHLTLVRAKMDGSELLKERQMSDQAYFEETLLHKYSRSGSVDGTLDAIKTLEDNMNLISMMNSSTEFSSIARDDTGSLARVTSAVVAKCINTKDPDGSYALHYAADEMLNVTQAITFLVSKGGDIWALNKDGKTPLHKLCESEYSNVDAVRALISPLMGNDETKSMTTKDLQDTLSLHNVYHLRRRLEMRKRTTYDLRRSFSLKRHNPNPLGLHTRGELKYMNINSVLEPISSLKKNLATYINMKDFKGESALNYAFLRGSSEIIELLVSKGGDIWTLENGRTPLHTLCGSEYSNVEAINALISPLKGDDVAKYINTKDFKGESALTYASFRGSSEIIQLLVSKGGDIWTLENGRTPLHTLCGSEYSNVEAINALISPLKGDDVAKYINTKDFKGESALNYASFRGSSEIIQLLVSEKGDIWSRNNKGHTPLHTLCKSKNVNVEVVRALLSALKGTDAAKYINTKDLWGETAVHLASRVGNCEVVELLMSCGGDIWALGYNRNTALHVNCLSDFTNIDVAVLLVSSCGSDRIKYMNIKNNNRKTARDIVLEKVFGSRCIPELIADMRIVFECAYNLNHGI